MTLKCPKDQISRIWVVLDHENRNTFQGNVLIARQALIKGSQLPGLFRESSDWQFDHKCRTHTFPITDRPDGPGVQFHNVPGDGQAKAQAPMATGRYRAHLVEAIEDARDIRVVDADPGIRH